MIFLRIKVSKKKLRHRQLEHYTLSMSIYNVKRKSFERIRKRNGAETKCEVYVQGNLTPFNDVIERAPHILERMDISTCTNGNIFIGKD